MILLNHYALLVEKIILKKIISTGVATIIPLNLLIMSGGVVERKIKKLEVVNNKNISRMNKKRNS